jgi:hypothetical protein
MTPLLDRASNLSRILHDALYADASMSLCARAWDRQDVSRFWRAWVRVFGAEHCRRSWLWHCEAHWPG